MTLLGNKIEGIILLGNKIKYNDDFVKDPLLGMIHKPAGFNPFSTYLFYCTFVFEINFSIFYTLRSASSNRDIGISHL